MNEQMQTLEEFEMEVSKMASTLAKKRWKNEVPDVEFFRKIQKKSVEARKRNKLNQK